MAQLAEGSINAGLNRIVGKVRVDSGMVRSEAGPWEPRLIVPVSIEMFARPADQMIALLDLSGTLHVGDPNNPSTQVGGAASISLLRGMPARSVPHGPNTYSVDLRFQLTAASVARIEFWRHSATDDDFILGLRLDGPLAWIRNTLGEARISPGQPLTPDSVDPFQMQLGLHSELSVLWTSGIDILRMHIEPSVWTSKVLPGFGVDVIRLIEVTFPPALPDIGNAAKSFDEARRAFNARRYEECIAKCRGVIRAWNKHLSASSKEHLAEVVGNSQRWAKDDPRRGLLDAVWQSLLDASNLAHHAEEQGSAYSPTAADARFQLMLTTVVSEYVNSLTTS